MDHLILYPQKWRLYLAIGGGLLMMNAMRGSLWPLPTGPSAIIPAALFLMGAVLAGFGAWRLVTNQPSFVADRRGYSVLGKGEVSWDAFVEARPVTIRYGLFPVASLVEIRSRGGLTGRKQSISMPYFSGTAREMAIEISAFARLVEMQGALEAARAAPPTTPQPAARAAFVPLKSPDDGPIRSTTSLGQRLFGRKPVI